jgi:hypothetical protein
MPWAPITGRVPTNGIFATIEKLAGRLMGPPRFLAGFSGVWDRLGGLPLSAAIDLIRKLFGSGWVVLALCFPAAEPPVMLTSSRLSWDDAPRPRTPEPPGLTLALAAQLMVCGLMGWTIFAVGVERLLPPATGSTNPGWTTAGSNTPILSQPSLSANPLEGQGLVSGTGDTVVAVSNASQATESATPSRELQIAAAGPTVPHSQH